MTITDLYEEHSFGSIVGFASVVGDFLHMGHINYLQQAKSECDILIVGLICSDPHLERSYKNTPIESAFERFIRLNALEMINLIVPLGGEDDLELCLKTLPIDKRFVGEEYKDKFLRGLEICNSRNIEIIYTKMRHGISSSQIRERVIESTKMKATKKEEEK